MTPERLRECLHTLGWWTPQLAAALGTKGDRAARSWIAGTTPVPANVATWLEQLTEYQEDMLDVHPPPPPPG